MGVQNNKKRKEKNNGVLISYFNFSDYFYFMGKIILTRSITAIFNQHQIHRYL